MKLHPNQCLNLSFLHLSAMFIPLALPNQLIFPIKLLAIILIELPKFTIRFPYQILFHLPLQNLNSSSIWVHHYLNLSQ